MPHFLDEPKEKHRSRTRSSYRGGQLEGDIMGCFYWWRPGFRCRELEEEVEREDTQNGEGNIDLSSVGQDLSLLETSLIAPIDTLIERV